MSKAVSVSRNVLLVGGPRDGEVIRVTASPWRIDLFDMRAPYGVFHYDVQKDGTAKYVETDRKQPA